MFSLSVISFGLTKDRAVSETSIGSLVYGIEIKLNKNNILMSAVYSYSKTTAGRVWFQLKSSKTNY